MADESEQQSANDALIAAALAFALLVDRYAIGLQNTAAARLAMLRTDIVGVLARIDPAAPARTSDRASRLTKVLDETNALVKAAYAELNRMLRDGLRTLANIAEEAAARQAERAAGTPVFTRRSETAELRSLADNVLVMGAAVKLWLERHAGDLMFRIATVLRDLALRERPLDEMLDAVRGSEAAKGADGVVGVSVRRIGVLVVVAAHAVSNAVRDAIFRRHPEVVNATLHVSILDSATTSECRIRHMKRWLLDGTPLNHSVPYIGPPPNHWGCRSHEVPILVPYDQLPARIKSRVNAGRFTDASPTEARPSGASRQPISASEMRRQI